MTASCWLWIWKNIANRMWKWVDVRSSAHAPPLGSLTSSIRTLSFGTRAVRSILTNQRHRTVTQMI